MMRRVRVLGPFVHTLAAATLLVVCGSCGTNEDGGTASDGDSVTDGDMTDGDVNISADGEGADDAASANADDEPRGSTTMADDASNSGDDASTDDASTDDASTDDAATSGDGAAADDAPSDDATADDASGEMADEAELDDSSAPMGAADDDAPTDDAMSSDDEPSDDESTGTDEPAGDGTEVDEIVTEPSSGCGGEIAPAEGPQTIDVDGTERSYIVSLPNDYDTSVSYPLVFAFHGLGGSGELVSNSFYFGIEQTGGTPSIFVYPDGLETGNGPGWANSDGEDIAFFDALLSNLQGTYCVDQARVFSTGHSYGGIMSHNLACQRADVLRAIAPVAGAHFGRGECAGPVAAWGAHGDPDGTVAYDSGLSAIQRVMDENGCDPDSGVPVEPVEYCTAYECDAGYPVTWCVHDEDHDWPNFAAESIKSFFDSF